jgi:predicted membrane protein DUF2306
VDAPSTLASPPASPRRSPGGRPRRRRHYVWLGLLVVAATTFLIARLPSYLGLDPSRSLVPIRPDYPPHYALLVGHIFFGSVALVTGFLQVWPWLRSRHPRVHRWTGRAYLFLGCFPSGVLVLGVAPISTAGFVGAVGNTVLALLWLGTSFAGYRAARRRQFAQHRAWMLRSVALTYSIVANRVWMFALLFAFSPWVDTVFGGNEEALARQTAEAAIWLSWLVNLLFVEWVLLRRPARAAKPA